MADRILADPARRKLFERETLYNLLTLPKRAQTKPSPEKEYSPTTYGGSSEESPQVASKEVKMRIKCIKVNKKVIKKDKKLYDFIKTEEKRLLSSN